VQTRRLMAPMGILGEAPPEGDPALLERVVLVTPSPASLTQERKNAFRMLTDLDLGALAGSYVQHAMSRKLERDVTVARAILEQVLDVSPPPRVFDNLLVVVTGLVLFEAWAEDLGIEVPDVDLASAIRRVLGNILDGGGADGVVKDGFDWFFEACGTYAHLGLLTDGTHYSWVDGMLHIHLPSCYEVYLAERRRTGQEDHTNGLRALRRIVTEKQRRASYVREVGRPIDLGNHKARCVVIDTSAVPDTLDVPDWPHARRTWGGGRTGWPEEVDN